MHRGRLPSSFCTKNLVFSVCIRCSIFISLCRQNFCFLLLITIMVADKGILFITHFLIFPSSCSPSLPEQSSANGGAGGVEVSDLLRLTLRTLDQSSGSGCLTSLSFAHGTSLLPKLAHGRYLLLLPAPYIPARAPRAGAAAQQRGRLARGRLIRTARGGAGARGH